MSRLLTALRDASATRRGFLAILGGTATGQALTFLASPILSRLFSPSEFGIFTIVSGTIMVLGSVAALRFDLAVPLPKEEQDAYSVVWLGLGATLCAALVETAVVVPTGRWIAAAFHEEGLIPSLWFVPAIASVLGAFLVLNQLALRQGRYGSVGRRNLLQSVSTVVTQLVAGVAGVRPGGLVLGLACGQTIGALSLLQGAGLRSTTAREGRERGRLRGAARRYRRFPLLLAPSGLLNVAGLQLPVLLIAYYYGAQVAGWLGLTQMVLSLPVMLIGNAVGQVYLGEVARAARGDSTRVGPLFLSTTRRLGAVSVIVAVALLVLARWAFPFVFGSVWTESGVYAQALSLSLAVQLMATPVSQTLIVFHRQATQLAWDSGRVVATAGAVYVCRSLGGSPLEAVWALSLTSLLTYGVSWLLSANAVRAHVREIAESRVRTGKSSCPEHLNADDTPSPPVPTRPKGPTR